MVRWLRLSAPKARGLGSIPGQGTRSHMPQLRPMTAKKKNRHGPRKFIFLPSISVYLSTVSSHPLSHREQLMRANGPVFHWITALTSGTTLVPILHLKPFSSTYLKPLSTAGPYTLSLTGAEDPNQTCLQSAAKDPAGHCGRPRPHSHHLQRVHLKRVTFHLLLLSWQFLTWNQETLVIFLKGEKKRT